MAGASFPKYPPNAEGFSMFPSTPRDETTLHSNRAGNLPGHDSPIENEPANRKCQGRVTNSETEASRPNIGWCPTRATTSWSHAPENADDPRPARGERRSREG